jgi:hypothetical protein
LGYFSSEIGSTQAGIFYQPGRYDGNAEYKPVKKFGHIITISTNRKFRYQLNK